MSTKCIGAFALSCYLDEATEKFDWFSAAYSTTAWLSNAFVLINVVALCRARLLPLLLLLPFVGILCRYLTKATQAYLVWPYICQ